MTSECRASASGTDGCEKERLFPEFAPTTYEAWYQEAVASLKGAPFEKRVITKTYEDIDLQPMYWAKDVAELPHMGSLPGFPAYVRGTEPGGYVLKPWDICQEIACSTPEKFNEAVRHELARGQNALKLVLDRPSRRGLDPDENKVAQVGKGGLSLATLDDLSTALRGIDLRTTPLTVYAGAVALPLAALIAAEIKRQGHTPTDLKGCIGADPLGEMVVEGSLPLPLETAYDGMASLVAWAGEAAPNLQTILVHGCPYHDAGASAVQELAYTVATAVDYLREMSNRNLPVSDVAPQMRFAFSLGANFFMEIAKLRAARLVWAQIIEALGGGAEAQKMTIHARTSAWTKTVYDPYVNMLRNTTEAFSGAMGGVDSMHVCAFDEPIRPAEEFSRRVSRNLQIILQEEAHFVHPIDAPGGSWYIEKLTDAVARKAWSLFQEIEAKGGLTQALHLGLPQAAVAATAARRAKSIDTRRDVLVGINMYPNKKEIPLSAPAVDYDALRKERASQLQAHRLNTDLFRFYDHLGEFSIEAGNGAKQLVERAREAALAGATLGDLWAVLGNKDELRAGIQPLPALRAAEHFEALRLRAERMLAETGTRPRVFLASVGPLAAIKPRMDFSSALFEVGGFEVLGGETFETAEEAARAAIAAEVGIVAICATDQAYPELIPPLVGMIKMSCPKDTILMAGRPAPEYEPTYREAGVDDFFFVGINCYEFLSTLQERS